MESAIARTRLNLDSEERFVALRRELGVTSFGINLILLAPGQRGRIHRHRRQEEPQEVPLRPDLRQDELRGG